MATLRNKVYKIVGNNTYYVPLARGLLSTALGSGTDDGQLVRAIPYAADITTQGILDMLIDLIENDNSINNEINGINRVICEGILPSTNYQFDYTFRYASEADGTIVLTSGHDWSSVSQTFGITIRSNGTLGSLKTITLNTNCADAAAIAAAINTQFIAQDIDDYVEARVDAYNRIYIRGLVETDPAVINTPNYNGFVLATGSPNALATLGLTAGTYTGNLKENTITGGAAKLHESDSVYSVYEIAESSVFDSPIVNTLNWYRRDLINIVFKDTAHPELVPYLEYIEGEETSTIPARHTLLSKSITTTKDTYPLWSILLRNDAGTFKYVEHDRVYNFGGFKETAHLIHTQAFEKVLGGFYSSLHDTVQFTKPDGTNLDLYTGTSAAQYNYTRFEYDLEEICHLDPSGRIDPQTPDIQFRADLARGDLLTFPFRMTEILDDYAAATDIELRNLTIAIDGNKRTEEGLELHIYTAKYFVDANNFGQASITTVSVAGLYTTLTLDIDIYATFTQLTANNKDFESPSPFDPPMAGDFIYIIAGKGMYEISMITDVAVGDDSHVIKIQTLPITPDTTSKILIFKASTIALVGTDITSEFLAAQTADNQIDYAEQYPYSTHTGISSLPYHDATYGYQEFGLVGIVSGLSTGLLPASEPFYFRLTIDGGTTEEYFFSITGLGSPFTYGLLLDVLNGNLGQVYRYVPPAGPHVAVDLSTMCIFEIVDGDIRCTSNIAGDKSSILFAAGTVGTNLFDPDAGQGINAPLETPVDGADVSPTYAKAKGTVVMTSGHNWAAANQTFTINQDYNGTETGVVTVTLNANCPTLALAIAHITAQLTAAGASGVIAERYKEDTIALKCLHTGTTYGFTIAEGTGALATLGLTAGSYYGGNVDLDDFYGMTPYASHRLFYHMPDPPATFSGYAKVDFPFKIRLNLNQWYFARVSIKDRNIPYMEYGVRPNIVTMDTTWAADTTPSTGNEDQTLNSYIKATVISNAGLYPLMIDGEQVFKIEDRFGDITVYSEARNLYYGVGRNLGSFVLEAHNLEGAAYTEPTTSGHVYVDVLNGIISFNTSLAEQPEDIWLTYYYNSILTGAIWTDDVHHERMNGEIWNLQMLIEQLVNPATATMSGSTTAIINISPYQLTSGSGIGDYNFQPGDVVRYDTNINPQFGWCKAVADNFHYVGDAMVIERISDTEFKIISIGYINNIGTLTDIYVPNITDEDGNNLVKNTIYYLSATVAGKITKNKPDVAQPIMLTFKDNNGLGVTEGLVVLTTKTSFFALYDVNQSLTKRCDDLSSQSDELTRQVMELMTSVSFLGGRVSQTSNYILDTFTSIENTSANSIHGLAKPGDIMDDGSSNLNWKEGIEASLLAYKQGYWRPRHQTYMAEVVAKYQLADIVPSAHAMAGFTYDPVNQCYWLITNLGAAAAGAIIKLTLDGRSVHFGGIWYLPTSAAGKTYHGIASDGFFLFMTIAAMPSGASPSGTSLLYKIPINSNGTIGNTTQYANGSTVTVDTSLYVATATSGANTAWHDVVIDGDATIGLLQQDASTPNAVDYVRRNKSDLAATGAPFYNKLENIVILGAANLNNANMTLAKTGTDLFIKVYTAANCAKIFKVNLVDDYDASTNIARCSGLFDFAEGEVATGGGITINQRGDILEAVAGSTAKFLAQRSLVSGLWAENQIGGFKTTGTVLSNSTACGVDANGYYYTANNTNFRVYQFNPQSIVPQYISITGVTTIFDIKFVTINGDEYMFVLADNSGTLYISYRLTSGLVFDDAHSYAISGGGGDFTATATPTGGPVALAWNYDDSIMYVLEATSTTIGTLEDPLGTPAWTADVYELPDTPVTGGTYRGLAYKSGKIFVVSGDTAVSSQIHVLPVIKQSNSAWWRSHVYNVPFVVAAAVTNINGIDFDENGDIIALQTGNNFVVVKSLENNDVMQVNTFIDDNNLITSTYTIVDKTPIASRFFNPSEFDDQLNCPDNSYMAYAYRSPFVGGSGYQAAGILLFHLDEFLSDVNNSGNYRYDVTKIRVQNLKMGGADLSNCYLAGPKTNPDYYYVGNLCIDHDMIFWDVVESNGSTTLGMFMLDLKSGISYYFGDNATYYRRSFNGSFSVKNSGNGYVRGVADNGFTFSSTGISSKIIARTFSKNDSSDYSEMNPKTFVIINTNSTLSMLIINWDSFGNRTPQRIISGVTGIGAPWLPASGYLFGTNGTTTLRRALKPVWTITTTLTSAEYTDVTVPSVTTMVDIATNSPCWRVGNIWEHRPIIFGTGTNTISIVDPVANKNDGVASFTTYNGNIFEDKIFVGTSTSTRVIQKQLFVQATTGMLDKWSIYENITATSIPRFLTTASEVDFDSKNGIAFTSNQMFHFGQQKNRCQHETIDFICDDPKYYYYRATIKDDGGPATRTLI